MQNLKVNITTCIHIFFHACLTFNNVAIFKNYKLYMLSLIIMAMMQEK